MERKRHGQGTVNSLLITGASSGIGLASAKAFQQKNYRIINISRRPCPLDDVLNIECDLSRSDDLAALEKPLTQALDNAGRIAVVHNAARLENDSFGSTSSHALRAVLEINLVAVNGLNNILKPLLKTGSSIIYVGSTLAEKAVPGTYSYVISKHALIGMMRATCQDLSGDGIHTACICPGFTDTEMLRTHLPDDAIDSIAQMNVFGRLIHPEEIAACLLFAAENPVVNGSVIHANLGQVEK